MKDICHSSLNYKQFYFLLSELKLLVKPTYKHLLRKLLLVEFNFIRSASNFTNFPNCYLSLGLFSVVSRIFLYIPLHILSVYLNETEGLLPWFGGTVRKKIELCIEKQKEKLKNRK